MPKLPGTQIWLLGSPSGLMKIGAQKRGPPASGWTCRAPIRGATLVEMMNRPRYDRAQSYRWNYDHPPEPAEVDVPAFPAKTTFCGLPVDSPLGIAAGPLLNGRWLLYYASLGFDVLTYKTVRSSARACYPLPNLQPVETGMMRGGEQGLKSAARMTGSWAVSFGMPSMQPSQWRADVAWTRDRLPRGKVLSVSVVGSIEPQWTIDDLADDYARCARWAVDSGADCVETNFSCPNVATCDGQLYQQPAAAGLVAERVREAIGPVPYLIKIGYLPQDDQVAALLDAVGPHANALAMTNSLAATVQGADGALLFDGQSRGICGAAIRDASREQVRRFAAAIDARDQPLELVGVGGIRSAADVRGYLDAGAQAVHLATAAMIDPEVGCKIRGQLAEENRQGRP